MKKHEEVVVDIITTLQTLDYEDSEKKLMLAGFIYNIYKFIGDPEEYKTAIIELNKLDQNNKKTLSYKNISSKHNK